MYWAVGNLTIDTDDIVHWWGGNDVSSISEFTGKIVLSNYNTAYFDVGFGGPFGTGYGKMYTWK